jgi:lycopene cyclase domain-containing protein
VRQLSYLALLAGCLLGTAPLELVLRTGVYARWRRLLLAMLPGLLLGTAWEKYAISRRQWYFDWRYLTGVRFGGVPLEELLFFLVIPICSVLTLEAVRRRRPRWLIGDEPVGSSGSIRLPSPKRRPGSARSSGSNGPNGPNGPNRPDRRNRPGGFGR